MPKAENPPNSSLAQKECASSMLIFSPIIMFPCCEINSAPQNHKELRVVMIPVKDLYTQHMNPNMQLIKRLFPPMKKFYQLVPV